MRYAYRDVVSTIGIIYSNETNSLFINFSIVLPIISYVFIIIL